MRYLCLDLIVGCTAIMKGWVLGFSGSLRLSSLHRILVKLVNCFPTYQFGFYEGTFLGSFLGSGSAGRIAA